MEMRFVGSDGQVTRPVFAPNEEIQSVTLTLGPATFELTSSRNRGGALDVHLRQTGRSSGRRPVLQVAAAGTSNEEETETASWDEMRGWFMMLATLFATVAYQAGLSPPGGFWQDDKDSDPKTGAPGHRAGDPVLRDTDLARYKVFNGTTSAAFLYSLLVIAFLLSGKDMFRSARKMMELIMIVNIALLEISFTMGRGVLSDWLASVFTVFFLLTPVWIAGIKKLKKWKCCA